MPFNDQLEALLSRLRQGVAEYTANEQNIHRGMVLPVLARLDWDTENVREIKEKFMVEKVEVDYALMLMGRNEPAAFIRVRKDDAKLTIDRESRTIIEYASKHGIEMFVCTTGRLWHFYLPCARGSYENRMFLEVDIEIDEEEPSPEETARLFRKFLEKENISDRSAITDAESLLQPKPREKIPEAWKELCDAPDNQLIELLTEQVSRICGKRPDKDDVAAFLKRTTQQATQPPVTPTTSDPPKPREPARHKTAKRTERGRGKAAHVTFAELMQYGKIQRGEKVYLCYGKKLFREEEAEIVVGDGKLRYKDNLFSTSKLAELLLKRHKCISSGPVQGPIHWKTRNGKLLHELNEDVRAKRGDRT